jgi:hypothetical protein
MTYKTRKFLFVIFIAIFATASPLIILYANGYGFDIEGGKLEKTGIVSVRTEPGGALIFIDNKLQENFFRKLAGSNESPVKTPAKISRLAPGKHEIRLAMEGYWDWKSKFEIEEGESISMQDILLFPKNVPVQMDRIQEPSPQSEIPARLYPSPDGRLAAIAAAGSIKIYDQENGLITAQFASSTTLPWISWSADSRKVLSGLQAFDLESGEKTDLTSIIGKNASKCVFDRTDSARFFCSEGRAIYSWNSTEGLKQVLSTPSAFRDFHISGSRIMTLTSSAKGASVEIFGLEGKSLRSIDLEGYSSESSFMAMEEGKVGVRDESRGFLAILDPDSVFPVSDELKNAGSFSGIIKGKMLFSNSHEIWAYDFDTKSEQLLTRLSGTIRGVAWHPRLMHVIYSTQNSISILEIGRTGRPVGTELFSAQGLSAPVITDEDYGIIFIAKIGAQTGLYKLGI